MLKRLNQHLERAAQRGYITALCYISECEQQPRSRAIMLATAGLTFGTLFACDLARADGFADMATHAADQGDSMSRSLLRLGEFGGIAAVLFGLWNWFRKGTQGQHSDVKPAMIWIPIIAGAALGSASYIKRKSGETIGISSSNQGIQ